MSRNSSGTYVLPAGNPVVTGTTISTTWANTTLGDFATEITDSASRSGKGGFTAPVRGVDGTVAAPAVSFTSEPGTGAYKAGASDYRIALAGVDAVRVTTAGITLSQGNITLTVANSGIIQTAAGSPAFMVGNATATDAAGVDVVLSSTATRTAGYLARIQNVADTTKALRVDYQGLVSLGGQAAAIQPASIWTAITPGANWTAGGGLAYFKDANGMVHLRGTVAFATGGSTTPFTLPAGFRPSTTRLFSGVDGSTVPVSSSAMYVDATGALTIPAPVNAHTYSVDAIAFAAEA